MTPCFRISVSVAILLPTLALADVTSEIESAQAAWQDTLNGDDPAATVVHFAEDGMLLPPDGNTVTGSDAIATFWAGPMDATTSVKLGMSDVLDMGDHAVEVGTWEATVPGQDGAANVQISGKTMVIWARQADGTWKMTHDMWNDDPTDDPKARVTDPGPRLSEIVSRRSSQMIWAAGGSRGAKGVSRNAGRPVFRVEGQALAQDRSGA